MNDIQALIQQASDELAKDLADKSRQQNPLPGTSPSQDYTGVMQDPYAAFPHQTGEGLRAGMRRAQHNLAVAPVEAARYFGASPALEDFAKGLSGAANVLTAPFGTPEGAAITASLGPVSRLTSAAQGMWPVLGKMLLPGAVGAGTAQATGGSPLVGGLEGVTAGGLNVAVAGFSNVLAKNKNDVAAVAEGIAKDVPAFKSVLMREPGSIAPMMQLRDSDRGYKLLQESFGAVQQKIVKAVGAETPLTIPGLTKTGEQKMADSLTQALGRPIGPHEDLVAQAGSQLGPGDTITIDKALSALLTAKAMARKAPEGNLGYEARQYARQLQTAIDGIVEGADPQVFQAYQAALKEYSQGLDVLYILKHSNFLRPDAWHSKGAISVLQKYLNMNLEDVGPQTLPALNAAARRGAPLSEADKNVKIPGVRFFTGGGFRAAESIPSTGFSVPSGTPSPALTPPPQRVMPGLGTVTGTEYLRQEQP